MFNKKLFGGGAAGGSFNVKDHFGTIVYYGNGSSSSRNITSSDINFVPDVVWIKNRDVADDHRFVNSIRGAGKSLEPNDDRSENNDGIEDFIQGGFSLATSDDNVNGNNERYVAWLWKCADTTTTLTTGDIDSDVRANTESGVSIFTFSGSGTSTNDRIPHGLGVAPKVYIIKDTGHTDWEILTTATDFTFMRQQWDNDTSWSNETGFNPPDADFIYRGDDSETGSSSGPYFVMAFAEIPGFSKFSTYTGTGSNTNPPSVTGLGFQPGWIWLGPYGSYDHSIIDDVRGSFYTLKQNTSSSESSKEETQTLFFTSDGFDVGKTAANEFNGTIGNSNNYLYWAFASPTNQDGPPVEDSFGILEYTGDNQSNHKVTGFDFTPSLLWIKSTSNSTDWVATDVLLDENTSHFKEELHFNNTDAAATNGWEAGVRFFDPGGFNVWSANYDTNRSGYDYVAYGFKGGPVGINNNGSVESQTSVNDNAGISIVRYEGATGNQTVGHGLSSSPQLIIVKDLDSNGRNWIVYSSTLGYTKYLVLNSSAAQADSSGNYWTANPSSTVFSIGTNADVNDGINKPKIAYCFTSISGFSSIGSYTGNASTTGPIITTGFEPSFVMIKAYSRTGNWVIFDSVRDTGTVKDKIIWPNEDLAEVDFNGARAIQFLSNGFQLKSGGGDDINDNSETYIYAAFKIN